MKQCPRCNRNYADEALSYCLEDGAKLVNNYEPAATLISPYPPAPFVAPTVAYQKPPVTNPMYTPLPAVSAQVQAPRPRSPWLIGALVLVALGVGLTIGGVIFQRSSASSTVSTSVEPERDRVATSASTPTPATSTPTPAAAAATPSTVEQSTQVQEPECVLYNDKSDKAVVNVRENCETRNCELDESTKTGEYPDNTAIRVIKGSNVQTAHFTWVKVIISGSGRIVWVAASKIKCL